MKAYLFSVAILLVATSQMRNVQAGWFDFLFPTTTNDIVIPATSNPGFDNNIVTSNLVPRSAVGPRTVAPPFGSSTG